MTVPTIARGVAKTLAFLPEGSFGVQAAGTAQVLRRTQAMINQSTQEIDSAEILPSQQIRDARQGSRLVQGNISGQMSCTTYAAMFANLFRNVFVQGVSLSGISDSVFTVGASAVTFQSNSQNFLTAGFKVGDVIALTGCTGNPAANNNNNLLIVALTANLITAISTSLGSLINYTSGQAAVTVSVLGQKLIMPTSFASAAVGSFSFESWFSDIGLSELALGCRVTSVSLQVPPSGFVTISMEFTGQRLLEGNSQQLASPANPTTTTSLTATEGYLLLFGQQIAYITGFNLQMSSATDAPAVVGNSYTPNIFLGNMMGSGSFTALLAVDSLSNAYLSEQEFQIQLYLTDSNAVNPNFVSVFLPRVKVFSDTKNDSDRQITRSMTFKCLEQDVLGGAGLAYDDTTITIQDSLIGAYAVGVSTAPGSGLVSVAIAFAGTVRPSGNAVQVGFSASPSIPPVTWASATVSGLNWTASVAPPAYGTLYLWARLAGNSAYTAVSSPITVTLPGTVVLGNYTPSGGPIAATAAPGSFIAYGLTDYYGNVWALDSSNNLKSSIAGPSPFTIGWLTWPSADEPSDYNVSQQVTFTPMSAATSFYLGFRLTNLSSSAAGYMIGVTPGSSAGTGLIKIYALVAGVVASTYTNAGGAGLVLGTQYIAVASCPQTNGNTTTPVISIYTAAGGTGGTPVAVFSAPDTTVSLQQVNGLAGICEGLNGQGGATHTSFQNLQISGDVQPAATGYSLTLAGTGTAGVAQPGALILTGGTTLTSTLIVTPTDGAGGTFSPAAVSIAAGSAMAEFLYTPARPTGTKSVSVSHTGGNTGMSDPAAATVVVSS